MESIIKRIRKVNTIISILSLWGPVLLLLIELYKKSSEEKKLYVFFPQLTPKMIIAGLLSFIVLYSLKLFWDLPGAISDSQANKESLDYLSIVDLYLENNFKMVSQKLFSCLVTIISIIALNDLDNISIYLYLLLTISVSNMISFSLLYFMSHNNGKREGKEFLYLVLCVSTNILTTCLVSLIILKLTFFQWMPNFFLFFGYIAAYILAIFVLYGNYYLQYKKSK